jgi:hypothetical protein
MSIVRRAAIANNRSVIASISLWPPTRLIDGQTVAATAPSDIRGTTAIRPVETLIAIAGWPASHPPRMTARSKPQSRTRDSLQKGTLTMRSPRGVAAAISMLLALPLAIVASQISDDAGGVAIHFALGAGSLLFAAAVFDFGMTRSVTWLGAVAGAALGAIFTLQAIAIIVPNDTLFEIAYPILGQEPERYLPTVIVAWFGAFLLAGTDGWTRIIGWAVVPALIGLEIGAIVGRMIGIDVPLLRVLYLLPFVWLLIESLKRGTITGPRHSTNRPQLAETSA